MSVGRRPAHILAAVSTLDWVILGFTFLLAFYGYLQGFVVGALSLIGFALGAFLGTRVAPLLLHGGDQSHYAPLFGLVGALLVGGVCASGLEGIGGRLRSHLRLPGFRALDGLLGAALTACVALGIAWIVGAVALTDSTSGPLTRSLRSSEILRALDRVFPPTGPVLNALSSLDPAPVVHGPAADVPAPTARVLSSAGARTAAHSVVKVFGHACGLGVEGRGGGAAPGGGDTTAPGGAGDHHTEVLLRGDGPGLRVTVLVFDTHDDLAVLRVPGLRLPALTLASAAAAGRAGAILGYPLDGGFSARAARLGQTETVDTQDAYGQGHVARAIAALRGVVKPGNSGGPVVGADGQVLATVFAAITGTSRPGGFAVPNSLVRAAVARAEQQRAAVATGHCAE